jgi:hypothetical protein
MKKDVAAPDAFLSTLGKHTFTNRRMSRRPSIDGAENRFVTSTTSNNCSTSAFPLNSRSQLLKYSSMRAAS